MGNDDRKKILIVEDDEDIRVGLGLRLSQHYDVLYAQDGISAMQVARSRTPDAIVLDLGLPGGDGFQVLEWMHDSPELSFTPVIVLTGTASEEAERRAYEAGARQVLFKPTEGNELRDCIEEVVEAQPHRRKRLLLIEDEADTREGMRMMLNAEGYEVATAEDGATALLAARKHEPHAILLDLGLPGGSGMKVLRRIKTLDALSHIPIVVLTGKDPDVYMDEVLACGAFAYLEKPASKIEVLATLGALK